MSRFRRDWIYCNKFPLHENYRVFVFHFGFTRNPIEVDYFNRGYFVSELIKEGDSLLDICCGDGFFTKRFYAQKAELIDGIDIDPKAICLARRYNGGKNISYHLLNAFQEPFPKKKYGIIAWNGGILYFPTEYTNLMLKKIKDHLNEDGIFAGSTVFGNVTSGQIQFLSLSDLRSLLSEFFSFVEIRISKYKTINGTTREEAYWRCANLPNVLEGRKNWDLS